MTEPDDKAAEPPPGATFSEAEVKARNEALRHLFMTDPHFRTSDGLEVAVDEAFEIASSPRARQRKIELARAMGMLDDELVEQDRPERGQGDADGA